MSGKVYPTDVSDEESEFVVPYLTLIREDAARRVHPLRDVFDAVRWRGKAGCPGRMLPGDFPRWQAVEKQTKRWREADGCEALTVTVFHAEAGSSRAKASRFFGSGPSSEPRMAGRPRRTGSGSPKRGASR